MQEIGKRWREHRHDSSTVFDARTLEEDDDDERMLTNAEKDVKEHEDIIIDHGYTGIVEDSKKDEIIAKVKVSIINRRSLYLKESWAISLWHL